MSANMVLPLHEVLGETVGGVARDALFQGAGMRYLPGPQDHVRERQVFEIHQSVRDLHSDQSEAILREAGRRAAAIVAEYRIPASAKTMLRRLPWPLATWMLVRSASQNAWTFGGSATFEAPKTSQLSLVGNPSIKDARSKKPLCVFHETLFQTLFRALVHPAMLCTETGCEACGEEACTFTLEMQNLD
ncbi:bacteriochlorophyll 4-vinyl reductase [Thalassococcus lentus]|uniref:Bacteriochlorophyll 4-vinyl reductase n=1 Tax=Thalassococcus lentus TaxID=1210524 RepID=A0ABT4XPH3_9RHOB|nr:bacteriochlorophyll 4-vinyl reductase [Thalassococcus lentus]MDA7423800.1 bacteriochlorophyll 4-vinyl reductase [Thalassococcus lentus]